MNYLNLVDQLRYMWSVLVLEWLFCVGTCRRREHTIIRTAVSWGICTAYALLFLLIKPWLQSQPSLILYAVLEVGYWLLGCFLSIWPIWFCFEMQPGEALFRGWTAHNINSLATTFLRSIIVYIWWPSLPERHFVLYLLIMAAVYSVFYAVNYRLIILAMREWEGVAALEKRLNRMVCLFTLLLVSLMTYASKAVGEWQVGKLDAALYGDLILSIKYYSAFVILVMNTIMLVIQHHTYSVIRLQNHETVMEQLLREKAEQYENSRRNIELINRKCHDLKHQISALRFAGEDEREQVLRETADAIMFYDAAVKTGNEALDTILTEKSLLCSEKKIRLSCTAHSFNIEKIPVVDLYTMLGNALDNAIECVEQFEDDEKESIRLQVRDLGKLLYLEIENYYEQPIAMRQGLPVTRKLDAENHGIGIRSIREIARRYGGEIHIETENQTFLLQIVIPA